MGADRMSPTPHNPARALRQHLESLQRAGLTHLPKASPETLRLSTPEPVVPARDDAAIATASPPSSISSTPDVPSNGPKPVPNASPSTLSREQRAMQLSALAERVAVCTRCTELASTRTQTVFGVGNPEARLLFVGEAPGADEDRQGEPFVGRAGRLLNDIITACKLTREEVYICNILRCRPPGNRNPSPQEASHCREYLDGQIATVDPDYIVCWGSVAAQNLLGQTTPIGKMRKRFFTHGRAKVLCTYHPSYLLRNPAAKKDVWDDMKLLFADMGVTL